MKNIFPAIAFLLILSSVSCSKKTKPGIQRPVYDVNVMSDITYGNNLDWQGKNEVLTLDVYAPKTASAANKYPLLLLSHGGSFLVGDKGTISDLCAAFADKGFIVASLNYRLGWNTGTAQCAGDTTSINEAAYRAIQDFNAALRFLTANAGAYFINNNWIFTGGVSAGAVAALNSTYITDAYAAVRFKDIQSKLGALNNADNKLTNTYTVKGICSMWGGVLDSNIITASNGIPTIAYHGSADPTIPVYSGTYSQCPNYQTMYGSAFICSKLASFGIPTVAHIYVGEGHGPPEYANDPTFISSTTFCFFQSLMQSNPQSGFYKQLDSNCQ